jgi:hypothetical protein
MTRYLARPSGTWLPSVGDADLLYTYFRQRAYSTEVREAAESEGSRMAIAFPGCDWEIEQLDRLHGVVFIVSGTETTPPT